jgi:DNA invertase Pin-like site-specific DNA recombinase
MGKMVFTILGSVAELERSMIVERVKAGLRNARAKGKRLGRPAAIVDRVRLASLRARGCSWRTIARQLGCSARTARRIGPGVDGCRKNPISTEPLSPSIADAAD